MRLNVRLFARARDLVGDDLVEVELSDTATVSDLRRALATQFPELSPLAANLLVAVGTEYANDSQQLAPDEDVACFPPVSGG